MKSFIMSLLALVSVSASAHEGGQFGTIYCIQNREFTPVRDNTSHLVVMNQVSKNAKNDRLYTLELYAKNLVTRQRSLILQDKVTVKTEDVVADFKGFKGARGERTFVRIYMDELNQSSIGVTVNGKRLDINLICRPNSEGLKLVQAQ
jgi:hypothetical protein